MKIDKRYKEDKNNEKRNWDFGTFPHERDYKYGWDVNNSAEHLSLKCSIPGCKFGGFAKIYNAYPIEMKNKILINNGKHDATVTPNWDQVDWNYGSTRQRNIPRMQQIDEYLALLNVNEDYGYYLGSRTDNDLTYVPLNWKREIEKSVKEVRAEMDTNCNWVYNIYT